MPVNPYTSRNKLNPYAGQGSYSNALDGTTAGGTVGGPTTGPLPPHPPVNPWHPDQAGPKAGNPWSMQPPPPEQPATSADNPYGGFDKFPGQTPPSPYGDMKVIDDTQLDPMTKALLDRMRDSGSKMMTPTNPIQSVINAPPGVPQIPEIKQTPGSWTDPDGTIHGPDGSVVPDTGPGGMTGRPPGPGPVLSFYDPNDPNATEPPPPPQMPDPQNPQAPPGATPSTPPGSIPGTPSPTIPGAPGGMPQLGPRTSDPNVIQQYVAWWAKQPGSDPSMTNDPQYWVKRITETGGIGADNDQYWRGRFRGEGGDTPGGGGGGLNFGGFTPSQGLANSGQYDTLWQMLMGRAMQDKIPNAKDPIIANQVNAYSAQQQRAARDYLSGLAEKGGPEANMAGETRMANENIGQSVGAMQASLMQNELTARRQEIQAALSQMGGMLTQEQSLALQKELALINASLNQSQFMDRFGLDLWDRQNYWDAYRSGGNPS